MGSLTWQDKFNRMVLRIEKLRTEPVGAECRSAHTKVVSRSELFDLLSLHIVAFDSAHWLELETFELLPWQDGSIGVLGHGSNESKFIGKITGRIEGL